MNKTNEETNTSSNCSKDRAATARLAYWGIGWLLGTALATFGPEELWDYDTLLTSVAIVIQMALGLGLIWNFKRILLLMDELQRMIQLEAMSLALGVAVVVGVSYGIMEDVKLIAFEPDISHLIMLISLSYMFGLFLGNRRYR